MPIYAYRCTSCGHAQDVLQKISDPLLTVCPACGQATYAKQVTAAGFQLKGSGWYVTDFRGNGGAPAKKDEAVPEGAAAKGDGGEAAKADAAKPDAAKPAADAKPAGDAKPAAPAPAPASAGGSSS